MSGRSILICVALLYAFIFAMTIYENIERSSRTLEDGIAYNNERNAMELCPPEAMARSYCPKPGEPYMLGTGCSPRVPTQAVPYCPKPGY